MPTTVSIILPAYREAQSLAGVVPALVGVMSREEAHEYEILVVDDASGDGTPELIERLKGEGTPVRCVSRADRQDGLSGAVLRGLAEARGDVLVVMDADGQHPPDAVPKLLAAIGGGADFALGSRYAPGATVGERFSLLRRLNSRVATALARPFSRRVSDPLSGFFAIRRTALAGAGPLSPLGYKIGLELLAKAAIGRVAEVPIAFGERAAGTSKLTVGEQFRYLEHLSRLYDFTYPRLAPVSKFAVVVAVSWAIGGGVVLPLAMAAGVPVGAAGALGYAAALGVTAAFHGRYVRAQRRFLARPRPWSDFFLIAATELAAFGGVMLYGDARLSADAGPAERWLLAAGAATAVRYLLRKELLADLRGLGHGARPPTGS